MLNVRPIFYASYRDLHDALISSKLRVSTDFLHDFLRSRGIVLSNSTSRETLIETIASYAYESADLDELCAQLEVHSKGDRITHLVLNKPTPEIEIKKAVEATKSAREGRPEVIDFIRHDGGRIEVKVSYYELDESRTLLRQQRPREGTIEFMLSGSGMRVRHPAGERLTEIAELIVYNLTLNIPDLEKREINLSAFSKAQRTKFFQLLLQKLEGYRTSDVKKVNVNRDISETTFSSEEISEAGDEMENEEEDADDKKAVENEVAAYLKRCTLDGSGILNASELKRFLESGFFISRIVWEATPRSKKDEKPKAELEALLDNPSAGLGFKYTIRGVFPQKRDKTYAITKRKARDVEREALFDTLEKAAQAAYSEVVAEINSTGAQR